MGTKTPNTFAQIASGYTNPADPSTTRAYCDHDRTHLATFTLGAQSPDLGTAFSACSPPLRASGIVTSSLAAGSTSSAAATTR